VQAFSVWKRDDAPPPGASYKAFISYKHQTSTGFALRLEQALKGYAKPFLAKPMRIFRDEKHFAPGTDLPKLIIDALDASEFLILLAAPEAAGSPWVHDEIDYWCRELKRTPNLLIVLVGGEIATNNETKGIDWTHTTALPTLLEPHLDRIPLYLDLRSSAQIDDLTLSHPDFKRAVNGITARFRGIDPNEMLGEEIHQHRRNLRLRNTAVIALAILTMASIIAAYVAVNQREQALQQAKIAVSRQYAAEATSLFENDLDDALLRAVKAVNTEQTFEARALLFKTLTQSPEIEAFLYRMREDEPTLPVASMDPTGKQVALATGGTLRLFDLIGTGAEINREIVLPLGDLSSVAFDHRGSTIALGGNDGRILLVNPSQGVTIAAPVKLSDQTVSRVFFNDQDDQLFAVSDGQVFRLSVSAGGLSLVETVQVPDPEVNAAGVPTGRRLRDISAATADGRLLVTVRGTSVVVWDLGSPIRQRDSFNALENDRVRLKIREVALSPDGKKLAVDVESWIVGTSDIRSSVQLYSLSEPDPVSGLASYRSTSGIPTRNYSYGDRCRLAFNNAGDHLLIGDRDPNFNLLI
jgi:hypothetical protein